jgi:hypothetical protein
MVNGVGWYIPYPTLLRALRKARVLRSIYSIGSCHLVILVLMCLPPRLGEVLMVRRGEAKPKKKPPPIKTCEACQKKFEASRITQRFCKVCFQIIYHSPRPEPRKCEECGAEFTPYRRQRFCSPQCQVKKYNRTQDIPGRLRLSRERARMKIAKEV